MKALKSRAQTRFKSFLPTAKAKVVEAKTKFYILLDFPVRKLGANNNESKSVNKISAAL